MKIAIVITSLVLFVCGFGIAVKVSNQEQSASTLPSHQYNLARQKLKVIEKAKKKLSSRLVELKQQYPGSPKAVVDSSEYDFGVMNPHTQGEHRFVIRNEGDGVLELREGGKTCHCVGFNIKDLVLVPGASTEVMVQWDTRLWKDNFRHGAAVMTSDKDNSRIELRVKGLVRTELGSRPEVFYFSRLIPGTTQTRRLIIVSETWGDFEIEDPAVTLQGASFKIEKATDSELKENGATCGYAIELTTPSDLPQGSFNKWFQATVIPEGDVSRKRNLAIGIDGHVVRKLAIYDGSIPIRSLKLGDVPGGKGMQKRFLVRVFDNEPELPVLNIRTYPDFIKAELISFGASGDGRSTGTYALNLSIPPECHGVYQGESSGSIRIRFDHPRIKEFSIPLTFNALSKTRLAASSR